jgi:hypothetical protein
MIMAVQNKRPVENSSMVFGHCGKAVLEFP